MVIFGASVFAQYLSLTGMPFALVALINQLQLGPSALALLFASVAILMGMAPPPKQIESVRGGLFDAGVTFNGFMAKELIGQMVSMLPFTAFNDARATSMALWATYEQPLISIVETKRGLILEFGLGPQR